MDKTKSTATITPHTGRNSFDFEPGLFGINTEVTRKGFFGGICAQMLNNRKLFMGTEGVDGWECTDFVRVIDRPEESLCRSNFVILRDGSMTQTSDIITLETGRDYEAAVWVRSISKKAVISFGLEGEERTFEVEADEKAFHKLEFEFAGRDSSSGELFKLMAGHKGGRVIECEADTDAVDFLLTDHGDHFYLSAVNRSAAPVSLDLKGFTFAVGKEIVVRECSFTDNNYSINEAHKAEISGNSILFATFSLTTQPF